MRICSLLPSATEIVYALGLGDAVVGVSHECDYPPAALAKPRIIHAAIDQEQSSSLDIDRAVKAAMQTHGSLYRIDEDALRRARPDLVITQSLCEVCAVDIAGVQRAVRALKPPPQVVSLHPHTLGELFEEIRMLGHVTNRSVEAGRLVGACVRRLERLRERLAPIAAAPSVFCLEWLEPPMASGHWVPEMVELAGGREVLGKAGAPSRYVTWDEVVGARPEVLIMMPCGFSIERTRRELPRLSSQPWWDELPAIRSGRVHLVNSPAYFSRPGPRLVDGVELLAGLLHPEISQPIASTDACAAL